MGKLFSVRSLYTVVAVVGERGHHGLAQLSLSSKATALKKPAKPWL